MAVMYVTMLCCYGYAVYVVTEKKYNSSSFYVVENGH